LGLGGTAGQQYDPCYHEACDTFANNNNAVLDLNSDSIAFATLTYAMNTQSVTDQSATSQLGLQTLQAVNDVDYRGPHAIR
jgi:hypothetical protein